MKLGEHLVVLLDKDDDADFLSRWMAHYIAEKITLAESSDGTARVKAEEDCFNAILALWKHRASFPGGKRPFESFDVIFRVLARLDPEASRGLYWELFEQRVEPEKGTVQEVAAVIAVLDKACRVLIEYALSSAVEVSFETNDRDLLEHSIPIEPDPDVELIKQFEYLDIMGDARSDKRKGRSIERIKDRIDTLDRFEGVAKDLRSYLEEQLLALQEC